MAIIELDEVLDNLRDSGTLEEQLARLRQVQVTASDLERMDLEASSYRVGSDHEEDPQGISTYCHHCGDVDNAQNSEVDLFWHPMSAFNFLDIHEEE